MKHHDTFIRIRNLGISLAVFAALFVYAYVVSVPVLRISVVTSEPPFVVKRKVKPLTEYLEQQVGMKFEFRPMREADALVAALLANKLDMVWIDGAHLAQARSLSRNGVMSIVQRAEDGQASSPSASYRWAVRTDMDVELRQKLTEALVALNPNDSKGREILEYLHADRYIPATGDFDAIPESVQRSEATAVSR